MLGLATQDYSELVKHSRVVSCEDFLVQLCND